MTSTEPQKFLPQLDGPFIAPASGTARQVVVFLHGYGANGDDLISIGHEWADGLPDAAFVSPHAPDICEMSSMGRQWFSIRAIDPAAFAREQQINRAAPILSAYIDSQIEKWGVTDADVAVVGFSQGAMMAMYTMPRRPKPCAGVIGYSGMLVDAEGLRASGISKMPVLAIHGDRDEVVFPASLAQVDAGFSSAGFNVETIMRPGLGHGIDAFGLMHGMSFLQECFENKK